MLAQMVTAVPGASEVFVGSAVVYAERLKSQWVAVPPEVLSRDGAVSPAVAQALAQGVRQATDTTYGVGITGYAGPGAGEGEPVGTVYLGLATPKGVKVERFVFGGDRERVRQFAAYCALDMVRRSILGVPLRP